MKTLLIILIALLAGGFCYAVGFYSARWSR